MTTKLRKRRALISAVSVVTEAHGRVFANEWFDISCGSLEMTEAIDATRIIDWPSNDKELQELRNEIVDDILAQTLAVVKEQVGEVFVAVANRVIARERRRPVIIPRGEERP